MNAMKRWIESRIPLGCDAEKERSWFLWGAVVGFLLNFRFVFVYISARGKLFPYVNGRKVFLEGAKIEPFSQILGFSLWGCLLAAAAMAGLAAWHYGVHFQGSKSIYTMRRLPQRWELLRRCLTVPALAAAVYLLEAAVLLAIDLAIYFLATPAQALPGIL